MLSKCTATGCAEAAMASIEERQVCRTHFLSAAYRHLESITAQIQEESFHSKHGESAGRCLEQCIREATNIACGADLPTNLERAQVLDILLWASELVARLRRGPRLAARIPILVRSEVAGEPWDEKTETRVVSMHGFSFLCGHELSTGKTLTCIRLDNGRRVGARVAWVRSSETGETEAGLEFVTDENFWGLDACALTPAFPDVSAVKPRLDA